MSCSEGDSKPALGEGPKVFILAKATLFILLSPATVFFWQGWQALAGISFFYFLLLLLGIILISDKDNA